MEECGELLMRHKLLQTCVSMIIVPELVLFAWGVGRGVATYVDDVVKSLEFVEFPDGTKTDGCLWSTVILDLLRGSHRQGVQAWFKRDMLIPKNNMLAFINILFTSGLLDSKYRNASGCCTWRGFKLLCVHPAVAFEMLVDDFSEKLGFSSTSVCIEYLFGWASDPCDDSGRNELRLKFTNFVENIIHQPRMRACKLECHSPMELNSQRFNLNDIEAAALASLFTPIYENERVTFQLNIVLLLSAMECGICLCDMDSFFSGRVENWYNSKLRVTLCSYFYPSEFIKETRSVLSISTREMGDGERCRLKERLGEFVLKEYQGGLVVGLAREIQLKTVLQEKSKHMGGNNKTS